VSGLAIIDGPPVERVRKGLLQAADIWPANANLDELALIDEQLIIIPAPL